MFDISRIELAREEGLSSYLGDLGIQADLNLVFPDSVVSRQVFAGYHQLRNRPGVYQVEFRRGVSDRFCDPQNFYMKFRIRDDLHNPTAIGSSLGIETRDPGIDLNSPEGRALDNFLADLARNYAGQLTNGNGFNDRISNLRPLMRSAAFHPRLDKYVII